MRDDVCHECRERLWDMCIPPGPCECELGTGDAEQCWYELTPERAGLREGKP